MNCGSGRKKCEIKHDRPDLGNNGLSVKAYVNNILNTHLEQYRDEINNLVSKPGNFKLG